MMRLLSDDDQVVNGDDGAQDMDLSVDEIVPGGRLGRGPPDKADDVLDHEHDGEGQQKLERFIPVIDESQQSPFDDDPDKEEGEPGQDQGDKRE